MNWHTIKPLVIKDLTLFFRNKFFTFITVLGLVAYMILFHVMPENVDEIIEMGIYAPGASQQLTDILSEEGVSFLVAESDSALQQAVADEEIAGGISLPADMFAKFAQGEKPTITIYLPSDSGHDVRDIMVVIVESLSLSLSGQELNINVHEEILGPDMAGEQIPLRNRMLPLFGIFILMMETMGLASLIAEEVETGTLRALLITPMGIRELFFAKGTTSVFLTLSQVSLFMLVIGAFQNQPLIIFTTLLLGSLLVTGLGFLMAAGGKDMLSVMGWGVLAILVLAVPAFGVMFPGTVTGWAKAIPTFYLADTLHQVINFNAGWSVVAKNLYILLGADILLFWGGMAVLKRKFS